MAAVARTHVVFLICFAGISTSFAADPPIDAKQFFASDHLVKISIEMKEEHWSELCNQSRDFVKALGQHASVKVFTYFPANVTIDGHRFENVGVRKKGFLGSLDSRRPSLKVKFNHYQKHEVSSGFDRLTLNNNKQDPSRLCQFMAYKLYNEAGCHASRCNVAAVTVNGRKLGLYSNVESVKAPMLRDRFGDDSGALYEGTTTDFFPQSVKRFEAKNKRAKYKGVEKLTELLDRESFTTEELEEYVDVKAFVEFWATESLIGFWDGYAHNQNNYFVYRSPKNKKFYFLPWGVDSAFTNFIPLPQLRTRIKSVHAQAIIPNRLYRDPEIRKLYRETIFKLLDDHWNEEKLIAQVDEMVAMIKPHVSPSNFAFARRVAEIKSFIKGRRAVIERELEKGAVEIKHGARRPIDIRPIGSATGKFSTVWSDSSPRNSIKSGKADLKLLIDGKPVEFKALGVSSEPSQDRMAREVDGRQPPTISYHAVRKSDGQRLLLPLTISSNNFHPSDKPVAVTGIVIEGNPLWFIAKMFMGGNFNNIVFVSGTVTLEQAERKKGAPVVGSVKLQLSQFQGGDHMPIR